MSEIYQLPDNGSSTMVLAIFLLWVFLVQCLDIIVDLEVVHQMWTI